VSVHDAIENIFTVAPYWPRNCRLDAGGNLRLFDNRYSECNALWTIYVL